MSDDIVPIKNEVTNDLTEKERDFDEQEAYFLLCQIFSYAQATKDYAKFQTDLNEWKKRFPVEQFSEAYKSKIKYMLSKEFLDTVLKNFIAFDELSKKDPAQGLEKLRKVLHKAEKHKNAKQLDKDLADLYKEFPLKFLKEKYPHIVSQLLSTSNRTRILEKFDSSLASKELDNIIQHPESFKSVDDFKETIEEWEKLYPISDFNDKFKPDVKKKLNNTLDHKNLEILFPVSTELDLSNGAVIPLELQETVANISLLSKDALYEFFNIVDKNKGDVEGLFKWICKYNRYINNFDSTIKTAIVDNLMSKYAYELPPVNTHYKIPKMDSGIDDLLSLSDYKSIDDTKKQVLLQVLGILSTGKELTTEDIYRISVIDSNAKKVEMIEKSKIEPKLNLFVEKFPEDKLIPSDSVYLSGGSTSSIDISTSNADVTLHNDEIDNVVVEDIKVHKDEASSFKNDLKVENTANEVVPSKNKNSSSGDSSSGGGSISLPANEAQVSKAEVTVNEVSEPDDTQPDLDISNPINKTVENRVEIVEENTDLRAVVLESKPEPHVQDVSISKNENENYSEPENEPDASVDNEDTLVDEKIIPKKSLPNFLNKFLGRKRNDFDRDDR